MVVLLWEPVWQVVELVYACVLWVIFGLEDICGL